MFADVKQQFETSTIIKGYPEYFLKNFIKSKTTLDKYEAIINIRKKNPFNCKSINQTGNRKYIVKALISAYDWI